MRQASAPACVETSTRLFTSRGWRKANCCATRAPKRLADHVRRARPDRVEPAGHVVGHVGRRVRTIESVGLSRVACVEGQGTEPRCKIALRPAECPVVSPQPTQEDERIAMASHFLVIECTALDDDLGHELNRWIKYCTKMLNKFARPEQHVLSVKRMPAMKRPKVDASRETSRAPGNRGPSRSVDVSGPSTAALAAALIRCPLAEAAEIRGK